MKKIIAIFMLLFLAGCTQEEIIKVEDVKLESQAEPIEESSPYADIIAECDMLCNKDETAYCTKERTIIINGAEVKGTCRAFSKKENVMGFNRCEGFCKDTPKIYTECTVDGKPDFDCDGKEK